MLAAAAAAAPPPPDVERLVAEHIPLARRIAGWWSRRVPATLREEIESAALLGLVQAARRFEPPGDFVAYAGARIRGAIQDEIRRHMPAGQRRRDRGSPPPSPTLSLDQLIEDGTAGAAEACAWSPEDASDQLDGRRALADLAPLLRRLDRRQRLVVRLNAEGRTERAIGEILGVTESRVCQILRSARRKLRRWVEERGHAAPP